MDVVFVFQCNNETESALSTNICGKALYKRSPFKFIFQILKHHFSCDYQMFLKLSKKWFWFHSQLSIVILDVSVISKSHYRQINDRRLLKKTT